MNTDWLMGLGLVLTSTVTALLGVMFLHYLPNRARKNIHSSGLSQADQAVFLFDGENLVDSSAAARAILASGLNTSRSHAWAQLMAYLNARFTDVTEALQRLSADGVVTLASEPERGDPMVLIAELRGGLTRITLHDPDADQNGTPHDTLALRAQTEELALLRSMMSKAPLLIWRQTKGGEVFWANPAYLAAVAAQPGPSGDLTWPLPQLFEPTASARAETGQRQKVRRADGKDNWYDLVNFADGDGRLCFGLSADKTVQAEASLRDFMQTLTKTFAQLQVGLAIFDSDRKLQLFNPALLDLTGLPIDFLSMRPTLLAVLDQMRDRNMIPEPKDYRSWRRQLINMEKAASNGLYEDMWTLPGGQTYRVVGRPHPNGALALIIEDISSEMLRTRRYKAELELGQAVLDEMDRAVAVFSAEGQLVMSNNAYAALWGHEPSDFLQDASVAVICKHWRERAVASTLWTQIETFVTNPGDRLKWEAEVSMSDGRLISCEMTPLTGGATLISFFAPALAGIAPAIPLRA